MGPSPRRHAALAASLALASCPAAAIDVVAGVPVAQVDVVSGRVEHSPNGREWTSIRTGRRLRTGEQVRTAAGALARIDFPFMSILVGSSSEFAISPSLVLSTSLQAGRVEQFAEGTEAIKLRTPEAEIRGGGRVVVRRDGEATRVAVLDGRFRVEARGAMVSLSRGEGSIVRTGRAPSPPLKLMAPPAGLVPGPDPVYVLKGQPVTLQWSPRTATHHLQVLGLKSEEVYIDRDVGASSAVVDIPWTGTYRWRVAANDPRGLEGLPSREGVVCVVEK